MKKLLVLLALFVVGCATTQSISEEYRTRLYEKEYAVVFGAVIKYCNAKGLPITMADKELGIINTDYISNSGLSKALIGGERGKLYFYVTPAKACIKLTAIITYEEAGAFGSYNQSMMTEGNAIELYDRLFTLIESYMDNITNDNKPSTKKMFSGDDYYLTTVKEFPIAFPVSDIEAEAAWERAKTFFEQYTNTKIQISTNEVLETYNATGSNVGYQYNITRIKYGDLYEFKVNCLPIKRDNTDLSVLENLNSDAINNAHILAYYIKYGKCQPKFIKN